MQIRTEESRALMQKPMPPSQLQISNQMIIGVEGMGLDLPITNGSLIVLVLKKDGTWRLYVGYRSLNNITVKN